MNDDWMPLIGRSQVGGAGRPNWSRAGSGVGLGYEFEWSDPGEGTGRLTFFLCGDPVWTTSPYAGSWALWSALVEGLARNWTALRLQEDYPFGTMPAQPSAALEAAIEDGATEEEAEQPVAEFEANHNLAAWMRAEDVRLPAFWLVREGGVMVVEGGGRVARWHLGDVLHTLGKLADQLVSEMVVRSLCPATVDAWTSRDQTSEQELARVASGLSRERFERVSRSGVLAVGSRAQILQGLDEVFAATRMLAGRVGDSDLRTIADAIRAHERRRTDELDDMSLRAIDLLDALGGTRPHRQGYEVAGWLRGHLGLAAEGQRFDPEALLAAWGVPVTRLATDPAIEAVAFWGAGHGPAILLNPNGVRSGPGTTDATLGGGARATLAHEICHLLIDRRGSLPAAEVLGGVVPVGPEARARAFAAEVLLPRSFAGAVFQANSSVRRALEELAYIYGVSFTLAAWQILNRFGVGSAVLGYADRAELLEIARYTDRRAKLGAD